MPTSPQEQADLDIMHAARIDRQVRMYDYMSALSRMDETGLRNSGHKSFEAALVYAFRSAEKDIARLIKEHLKKYPD